MQKVLMYAKDSCPYCQRAEALLAQLQDGTDIKVIADAAKVKVEDAPGLSRRLAMQTGAEVFFSIPAPREDGAPAAGQWTLPDNGILLFVVDKVTPAEIEAISDGQRAMLRQELATVYGEQDAQTLLKLRRQQMKISVFEERL